MKFTSMIKPLLRSISALVSAAILLPTLSVGAAFSPAADPGDLGMDLIPLEETVSSSDPAAPAEGLILSLEDVKARLDGEEYIPHVWPVRFTDHGYISSYYGNRLDPVTEEYTQFHGGLDLADKPNTRIHASAAGTVIRTEEDESFGLTLVIDHGNGYETRYSHCSLLLVEEGDEVSQGQVIASMGATGRATGIHLDFRVYWEGTLMDPMLVLDPLEEA